MKEFFKKIWARIKAFFGHQYVQTAITLILCIALCLGVVFGVRKCNNSMSTVSASAESEEYEDALNTYSGFNLLPFPYHDGYKQENGLTFAPQIDGRIGVFGMNSATSVFTIYYNKVNLDIFEIGKSYTASMRVGGASSSWYLQINAYINGSPEMIAKVSSNVDVRFTVPSGTTGFNIFFVALARDTYIDTSIFPMITLNSYVYDWTPPVGSIYLLGYNQGNQEGYQEGYQEGMNTASRGIFKDVTGLLHPLGNAESKSFNVNYLSDGVTFANVTLPSISSFNDWSFGLRFNPGVLFGSIKNFRATGASIYFGEDVIWGIEGLLPNGDAFTGQARLPLLAGTDNVYAIQFSLLVYNVTLGDAQEISIETLNNSTLSRLYCGVSLGSLTQFSSVRFWADNSAYYVGYQNGYTAGVESGEAYYNGYEEGYKQGDSDGYDIGYSEGLAKAEKFDFAYAISTVLGAPVQVIQEFLDFELLGVDMLGFVSGLFTLMIIVKIIKIIL